MKSTGACLSKMRFVAGTLVSALIIALVAANGFADTDMIWTYDSGGGADYSALYTWEVDTDKGLTPAYNVVVVSHGGVTGSIGHGNTVTGNTSGATGTVVGVVTASQICIDVTSGDFQNVEQIYRTLDVDYVVSNSPEDTLGIMYLDCYDGPHDDHVELAGATANSNHYRCIRSAPGCTMPFAGKRGTGAYFETTHSDDLFTLTEDYCRVEHVGGKLTNTHPTDNRRVFDVLGDFCKVIGCVMYDSAGTGTGMVHGIRMQGNYGLVVNSIAHDNTGDGFRLSAIIGKFNYAYNCTAVDNDMMGFEERQDGVNNVWNCVGDNNGNGDFANGFASGSNNNMSKDTTAPGTNSKTSKDFTNMWASEANGLEDYHMSATAQTDSDFQGGADPYGTLDPPDYTLVDDIDRLVRGPWYRGADESEPRLCVWSGGSNSAPYMSWETAALSIQVAINTASSGSIVTVRAGTYNENITMSDGVDVEKEALGNDPAIVGDATAAVVTFDGAFFDGCTLDGFDISMSGSGTHPGVYFHGTGAGIANSTATENCGIHGNTGPGIEVVGSDGATAPSIDTNEIYSNDQEGIYIRDGGGATEGVNIVNNTIHDNTLDGINVGGTSYVNMGDNNDIYSNTGAGIASGASGSDLLLSGSSITVRGNTIGGTGQGNGSEGIALKGSGSGVELVVGGSSTGDRNLISSNAGAGVHLENIDEASIENNVISNNSDAGILLVDVDTVSPHIRTNDIHDQIGAAGINIGGTSSVTIGADNDIYDNYAGIVFYVANNVNLNGSASSQPVMITGNHIFSNTKAGIAVIDNATGTITIDDNKIYQNTQSGIAFFNACTAVITGNEIYTHTSAAGIFSGDWSGTLPPTGSGFDRTNGPANLTIERNKVYDNRSGMRLDHASGTINNNLVYGNSRSGIRFSGNNLDPYAPFGSSWGVTVIKNNTVVNNGSYVEDIGQGISEDRGGGIVYDAIYVTTDPITELGRDFYGPPVGATQDPITIKNNILSGNRKAGIKFCADNSAYDRSYNLFYRNFEASCATGGAIDCARMCRSRTLGMCYSPSINCCAEEDTWAHSGVAFPGAWATGEMCGQDPLFNADYTLQGGSPAIGADEDGNDMGAYGGSDPITW